jgi:hypothetical protein
MPHRANQRDVCGVGVADSVNEQTTLRVSAIDGPKTLHNGLDRSINLDSSILGH